MPNGEEQFTDRQLKVGTWYVERKNRLQKIGLIILIAFDALAIIFVLWTLVDLYLISWKYDVILRQEIAQSRITGQAVSATAPEKLKNLATYNFASGDKIDFVAQVQNPNLDWYATFTYQFASEKYASEIQKGFILPGEEKYLAVLGAKDAGAFRNAQIVFNDFSWHRIDHEKIRNIDSWLKDRLNFEIKDEKHTTAFEGSRDIGRTSFTVKNNSAFGYWSVGFPVVLLRGRVPQAVNYITLEQLDAGETRKVDVNWFEQLPATTEITILSEVNVFDPTVFMPPKAE